MIIGDYYVDWKPHDRRQAVVVIRRQRRVLGFLWRPVLAVMTGMPVGYYTAEWYTPAQLKDWFTKAVHEYEDHKARWAKWETETAKLRRAGKSEGSGT